MVEEEEETMEGEKEEEEEEEDGVGGRRIEGGRKRKEEEKLSSVTGVERPLLRCPLPHSLLHPHALHSPSPTMMRMYMHPRL